MIHPRSLFRPVALLSVLLVLAVSASPVPGKRDSRGPLGIFVVDGTPVHDVGNLHHHASNWGAIGSMPSANYPFSFAPSAQSPAGSGVEYLFLGGLWVGGIVGGVASVSTAAYQFEFRPALDPRDIVYESAFGAAGGMRIPSPSADDDSDGATDEDILDGYDNDLDGLIDEDYAAISDQMLSRIFRDDAPEATQIYPEHRPMHLAVREESYQFSHADYDDFVGFTFWITNDGDQPVEDAYLGVFADGDAGHRDTPDYWEDDAVAYEADVLVDHGAHGVQGYDFAYWYDADGDAGQAPAFAGIVVLDHPTDPAGLGAPPTVGVVTYATFSGAASYENGGDPTNDFERYELMSSQAIEPDAVVPRDHRTLIAIGPFASIAPGETIEFSFALVVTPRADFTHVRRAAEAYHGLWFDLDRDPSTGIHGREHQEHWYLPGDNPVPVAITRFEPRIANGFVHLAWDVWADEDIAGFEVLRADGDGELRRISDGMMAASQRTYVDRAVEPATRYDYQLVAHGADGWTGVSPRVSVAVPAAELALRQNVPNPFTTETSVSFTLARRGHVELAVYDVAGRRVATIFSGDKGAGAYDVQWNGRDHRGKPVSAGVYFCRIEAGTQSITRKMVVMR